VVRETERQHLIEVDTGGLRMHLGRR
jgi:hypothetical protein